jgi:hypothetical protein
MQGIEFETPLVLGNSTTGRSTGAAAIDHTTRSMLVFNGALQVHALFDFLLNRAFTLLDNVCDVPVLISPVQFANAAIKKFALAATSATASAAAAGTSKAVRVSKGQVNTVKTLYTVDVKGGMIPGWVADRLLRVITSEDSLNLDTNSSTATAATLSMVSVPLPASVALNWHLPASSKHKDKVSLCSIGGCVSDAEAMRWSTPLEALDTAAVREIKFTSPCGQGKNAKEATYQIVQATNRILPITV